MEGSSRAGNSDDDKEEEYPEELKHLARAALTLCTMKNSRPEPEDMPVLVPIPMQLVPRPPVSFHEMIGECSEPYDKQLTLSDVKPGLNRLNIKKGFAKNCVMPMLRPNESLDDGILVDTYDLKKKLYVMMLKLWGGRSHVLNGGWNQFVLDHGLDENDYIRLWMFRRSDNDKLCFVILKIQ